MYSDKINPLSDNQLKHFYVFWLTATAALVLVCITLGLAQGGVWGDGTIEAVQVFAMLVSWIMLYCLARDVPWDRQNRSLLKITILITLCLALNTIITLIDEQPQFAHFIRAAGTFEYWVCDMIPLCFMYYIASEIPGVKESIRKVLLVSNIITAFSILLDLANIWTGWYFTITPDGVWITGTFDAYGDLEGVIIYVLAIACIVAENTFSWHDRLVLFSFLVFPMAASTWYAFGGPYMVYVAEVLSIVLIYNNIFIQRRKKMMEQKLLLDKQSTALMISQIQPHFLYNTLTTISNLCTKDPEEAEETTVLFSQYLRTNLDSLRQMDPVPFAKELSHIKIYVELEQKRFGDKLNVEYDIQDMDFVVPALGLQPIVENSIKHGICQKTEPGHLKFSSRAVEAEKAGLQGSLQGAHKGAHKIVHQVIIEDDGVGFDPNGPMPADGRSHVGMQNVRSRLMQMCGATMEVTSAPGCGCKTVVTFPGKEK